MMPSQRRSRLIGVLVIVTIIVILYISKGAHQTQNSDFYTKTQQALQEREHEEAARQRDADSVQSRLQAAEEQAKKSADDKYIDTKDDKKSVPGVAAQGGRTHEQAIMHEDETAEEHEVEMEMNAILKKSPGTSFCSALPYAHR
jgi:hypothetical protein